MSSINASIYIPRMHIKHTQESIAYYMAQFGIVSHVDFTPINKKPGFGENVNEVVKSAFVHFSDPWFCNDKKKYHFQSVTTGEENNTFWKTIASGIAYKLQVSNEYWLCLKNKNPIQRTFMNIHQVVENGRYLESLIHAQAKKIAELENKIKSMLDFDTNCFNDGHDENRIEKPSLYETFNNTSDIREIIDLINKYDYTDEEVSEVINIYEPYENNYIPEVEHIETLLMYFPKSKISYNTMNAIKNSFPDRVKYILELQNINLERTN